jgi:hypothetical protein
MSRFAIRLLLPLFVSLVSGAFLSNSAASQTRPLIYVIPQPGARHISPTTSLAVHEGDPLDPESLSTDLFEVSGRASGAHSGKITLSDDGRTLLFYPDDPFIYGETVDVTIRPGLSTITGAAINGYSYQFAVIDRPLSELPSPPSDMQTFPLQPSPRQFRGENPNYHTHPEFTNIMTATVTTAAQDTKSGLIFVAALGIFYDGQRGLLILDDEAEPVYIKTTPGDKHVTDFKRQTVAGEDYLTYHVGTPQGSAYTSGSAYVMNDQYQIVDTWDMGNGYEADEHEFLLLDNGHAAMVSYHVIPYDLRPWGGPANGALVDIILQELDPAKNVIFEWHASQHIPIGDTQQSFTGGGAVDFFHTNSIEIDSDGNWLISSRNTSEVTKLNRQTGEVIWRMGGAGNEFTFTNDSGFWRLHDVRRLANGNITVFDNGNEHNPPYSRAVEYVVDEQAKTVTRVWQYPEDTSLFAAFMANAQRLGNGNTMIGWGALPKVSEVTADGDLALEMALGGLTYRAFRFDWDGMPAEMPRAAIQFNGNPSSVTLYASWNGATDIEEYDVYAGSTSDSMTLLTTVPRTGFETTISLTGLTNNTCFFQVHPIHAEAVETPYSRILFRPDLEACQNCLKSICHSWYPDGVHLYGCCLLPDAARHLIGRHLRAG